MRALKGQDVITLFIRHGVNDFDAFKKGYDDLKPIRDKLGVLNDAMYTEVGNENNLTVTHTFATQELVDNFLTSSELQAAVNDLGVIADSFTAVITEQV